MKVAIGNDHAALELKRELLAHLVELGAEAINLGTDTADPVDYPEVAATVARSVAKGEADLGVIICGTGIGVSIAANKIAGIRAALCCCEYHARMAREHNAANICCLGARVTGSGLAKAIVTEFITTPVSSEPRHLRRVEQIIALEGQSGDS